MALLGAIQASDSVIELILFLVSCFALMHSFVCRSSGPRSISSCAQEQRSRFGTMTSVYHCHTDEWQLALFVVEDLGASSCHLSNRTLDYFDLPGLRDTTDIFPSAFQIPGTMGQRDISPARGAGDCCRKTTCLS